MSRRVTFLTAAVSLTLLLAGCGGTLGPAPERGEIRFEAGSLLLDDAPSTKFGDIITGSSFANSSSFLVYGRHNTDSPLVFALREITLSGGKWSYDNPEQWNWTSNTDYYDFLALYLGDLSDPGRTSTPSPSCNTGSPMYATVPYDPAQDQYDLMLAGKRRTFDDPEGRTSTVSLTFEHMLCAVQFKVINGSGAKNFTIKGYHFDNLVSRGTAKIEAGTNPTYSWTGTSRLIASVGGTALNQLLLPSESLALSDYDLMIPQSHNEKIGADGWPALVLDYVPDGGSLTTVSIPLKDILEKNSSTPISAWERSKIYVYEIELNLDGGIQIHVTTTDWDPVSAETPGLLLPTF